MLGDGFEHFLSLDSFRKASFILGSGQWEDKLLEGLRNVRLYGSNPSVQQSQSQIVSGELQGVAGGRGELKCLGGETDTSVGVCSFVNGSAHCSGCVHGRWLPVPPEYYYSIIIDDASTERDSERSEDHKEFVEVEHILEDSPSEMAQEKEASS